MIIKTGNSAKETINARAVQHEDYERICSLLLRTQAIAPPGFNWDIRRWEGSRWYDSRPEGNPDWHKNSRLWETGAGRLIGLIHPDGLDLACLELHPDYRHLEEEMIAWAESHLAQPMADSKGLQFFAYEYDVYRQKLLEERGYLKTSNGGVFRRMRLGRQLLVSPKLAAGYALHTTRPGRDHDAQQVADLLNAAFNRTFHTALEYQQFTRNATCFRSDLDLVAVAPSGPFAAYVGVPYDQFNRRGIFEPVCTHPDHRQKGLAKALMQEGLLRLRAVGAIDVVVETGDMVPANRLYDSLGFTEKYSGAYWLRTMKQ